MQKSSCETAQSNINNRSRRSALTYNLIGAVSISLHFLNTFFAFPFFLFFSLPKLLHIKPLTHFCNRTLNWLGSIWIGINTLIISITKNIHVEVTGLEGLRTDEWYLVISNHRSWADIFLLQKIFNRKIPFLKFFLKKELVWVPFMGIAWWGLDFPFMKRYSKAFLKKNPHLKGKDIEITRRACEKFKHIPVSVMNFVEGTRFTDEKHARQKSQFTHLLNPRAGGISFVLSAMGGERMRKILNVSISYSDGIKSFWEFLCGKIARVRIHIEEIPITDDLIGDYDNDEAFRENFQAWLNRLWIEKDQRLKAMSM